MSLRLAPGAVPGSLRLKYRAWKAAGAGPTILSWVKNGFKIPLQSTPPPRTIPNHRLGCKEMAFVDTEIPRLLLGGAVERCTTRPRVVSPLGVVPKRGGKLRLIHNLSWMNTFVQPRPFKYESWDQVATTIQPGDKLATLDLESGFHHVEVHPASRSLLGFEWKGVFYRWKVLPFGLSVSPYAFCKVMRVLSMVLRQRGHRHNSYVDDLLFMSQTATEAEISDIRATCARLGVHLNLDKSLLEWRSEQEYLGLLLCCPSGQSPQLRVPREKLRSTLKEVRRLMTQGRRPEGVVARRVAQVTGRLVSLTRAVFPARLHLRGLYRAISARKTWATPIRLGTAALSDLQWWYTTVAQWNGRALLSRPVETVLETDASGYGWGATLGSAKAAGQLPPSVCRESSNHREIYTVLLSLRSFLPSLKGKAVLLRSDNTTTVAYVNRLGGSSKKLDVVMAEIITLCRRHRIQLTARHVPGVDNVIPDRLSRIRDHGAWGLKPHIFGILERAYGPHSVDRFASETTTLLPRFNSQFHCPGTEGVDALSLQWHGENNLVVPPLALLPKVLQLLRAQPTVSATVVAPLWPAQEWCQELASMSSRKLELPNTMWTWRPSPGGRVEPLRNPRWRMFAWRVCGATPQPAGATPPPTCSNL